MDFNRLIEDLKTGALLIICLPFILVFLVPLALLADYVMKEEQNMHWGDDYPD